MDAAGESREFREERFMYPLPFVSRSLFTLSRFLCFSAVRTRELSLSLGG